MVELVVVHWSMRTSPNTKDAAIGARDRGVGIVPIYRVCVDTVVAVSGHKWQLIQSGTRCCQYERRGLGGGATWF